MRALRTPPPSMQGCACPCTQLHSQPHPHRRWSGVESQKDNNNKKRTTKATPGGQPADHYFLAGLDTRSNVRMREMTSGMRTSRRPPPALTLFNIPMTKTRILVLHIFKCGGRGASVGGGGRVWGEGGECGGRGASSLWFRDLQLNTQLSQNSDSGIFTEKYDVSRILPQKFPIAVSNQIC